MNIQEYSIFLEYSKNKNILRIRIFLRIFNLRIFYEYSLNIRRRRRRGSAFWAARRALQPRTVATQHRSCRLLASEGQIPDTSLLQTPPTGVDEFVTKTRRVSSMSSGPTPTAETCVPKARTTKTLGLTASPNVLVGSLALAEGEVSSPKDSRRREQGVKSE